MRKVRKVLIALLVFLLVQTAAAGHQAFKSSSTKSGPDSTGQRIRVLFIGNSYTYFNDLPSLLSQLAASRKGSKLETSSVTNGGATLKRHWEERTALQRLKQGRWDYVVLQEQSLLPINDRDTMHRYARLFDAEIKKAGAKTVFFLTWARQNRPEMQQALTDAYFAIAGELGARVAPVGIAWQNALKDNPKLVLHNPDQSHPNAAGSYLAACVFYALFYDKTPEGLSGRIPKKGYTNSESDLSNSSDAVNLTDADARFIQRVAWETVRTQNTFNR
ncbi:MAG: SGNH/GDSL hydrolase family protein [Blastocatellia bacterium]|nr:SGNH/GDSL hydrolase family protein [Blastocatellia bacterium]